MKCILYGIGSARLRVEKYLRKEHQIVGYSDSFSTYEKFENKKFYKPIELVNAEYDIIIICIGDKAIRKSIIKNFKEYKIDLEKVFDFYEIYLKVYSQQLDIPLKNVDRIMCKNAEEYKGVILGISHAQCGINPKYLRKKFCNLALGSQDLYYNLKTLKILKENYFQKIKGLEYAIIDMYDYTYFNYDVSLSKNAIEYYRHSGFRDNDSHNYKKNRYFNRSIQEEIINIDKEDLNLFNELFENNKIDINSDYKKTGAFDRRFDDFALKKDTVKCITDKEIDEYKNTFKESSIEKKCFKETIKENKIIFDDIMSVLTSINPEIKIYLILLPVHKEMIQLKRNINLYLKENFYNILKEFEEVYNFKLLDFYEHKEISSQDNYFYDIHHLNYDGATIFTKMLNSYIEY